MSEWEMREQERLFEEEARAAEEERRAKLRSLVHEIEQGRDRCIQDRLPIEQRWVDDCRRINGELNYSTPTKSKPVSEDGTYKEPHLGYVKARCDQITARLSDMMFPHNDRNWDMGPTPDPELGAMEEADPQRATAIKKQTHGKCMRMRQKIDDQLTESRFNAVGRRAIDDCVRLGSCVMKGPVLSLKTKRKFTSGPNPETGQMQSVFQVLESTEPGVEFVDPWFFFPELTETVEQATQSHQLHVWSKRKLQEMRADAFFEPGAITEVLKQEPGLGVGAIRAMKNRCSAMSQQEVFADKFAVWESYKFLCQKDLAALGIEIDDAEEFVAPLYEFWHCNGVMLKARPVMMEDDNRIPYYVVPYARADDTMFGFGVSHLLRNRDRDIQAAWRMALHNAALSAGPLVMVRKNAWQPADGSFEIRGPKIIEIIEDEQRISLDDIIRTVSFKNEVPLHLELLNRAIALADEEIGMPAIMTGNPSMAVPTSSGLAMLMNASNIVQRRFAKMFDDYLISPLIERFYWWNMVFGDDDGMKGDFDVQPLGTSQLLVKDIQAQHLQIFSQMAADPRFAPYVHNYNLLQANLKMLDMPTDDLVLSEADAEEKMKNQPPDPVAQAEQVKSEALMAEIQLSQARLEAEKVDKARDDDYRSRARMMQNEEFQMDLDAKLQESRAKLALAAAQIEMKFADVGDDKAARLALEQAREETKRHIAGMKLRIDAEKITAHREEMALKLNPANQTRTGV